MAAALALLCTLSGCSGTDDDSRDTRQHPVSGQSWTFLVYMVADNNLEAAALDDVIEMADVPTNAQVNIVVQMDRAQGFDESGLGTLPNWTTAKRLKVTQGALQELGDLGEVNMGDARTLSDFISWGVKAYPADRYALIFWDHGAAWPGFGSDDSTPDDDTLTLAELKSGLQAGMDGAGLQQFSLIGFDACLMATVEVALALRPYGEYLLASEQLEPGHGWDYRALSVLAQDPSTSPLALGKQLIGGFKAQATQANTVQGITLSLTDLYALDDLKAAVEQLATVYPSTSASSVQATAFGRGRASALEFGKMPNPAQSTNMVDLGDLSAQLASRMSSATSAHGAVNAALGKAVVARTSGSQTARASGLSIYFPPQRAWYDAAYGQLPEMDAWRRFLTRFLQSAPAATSPAFSSQTAATQVSSSQVSFQGSLSAGADSITTAALYYGYAQQDGKLVILGDRTASVSTSGSPATVTGAWNYSALKLTQGGRSGYAYLSLEAGEGGQILATLPFNYSASPGAPAQPAVRVLLLDGSGTVTQDAYYLITDGGFGELYADPGSVLEPLVEMYDHGTDTTSFEVLSSSDARFDATQDIQLGFERLVSGTRIFGILNVEDYSGAGDQSVAVVVTP